jgi:hypothetical protein
MEAVIESGLNKTVEMFSGVRVEKERQTRSDKAVAAAEDEGGRSLIDVVSLEIEKAA